MGQKGANPRGGELHIGGDTHSKMCKSNSPPQRPGSIGFRYTLVSVYEYLIILWGKGEMCN
jgi:hypothetical protein